MQAIIQTDRRTINYKNEAEIIQIGYYSQNIWEFLDSTSCYSIYTIKFFGILVALYITIANWFISQIILLFLDNQLAF